MQAHYQQQQSQPQKSSRINDQATDSKVLSEATIELDSTMIPDKTTGKNPSWTRRNAHTIKDCVTGPNQHGVTR